MNRQIVTTSPPSSPGAHPERFEPDAHGGGRLMEAEHRGRYWWAAQLAAGRDVLDAACGTGYGAAILADAGAASVSGIDLDPDAVAEARRACGERAEIVVGDVRTLPFDDASFDLVVCWETIEHVAEGDRVVAEFRRVLRPDGLLLISSPNPDVYPAGNEHHVHEYRPDELLALVAAEFSQANGYGQYPGLAAAIWPSAAEGSGNGAGNGSSGNGFRPPHGQAELRDTAPARPDGPTYGIVVAGAGPLPSLQTLVAIGSDFELDWLKERLAEVTAKSTAREASLREQLQEAGASLLSANQELALIPVLRQQVASAKQETARIQAGYERSLSWRVTAPLRALKATLRNR